MIGRESLARAGKLVTGNPPFGFRYDSSTKQLRHDENEKSHVPGMFNWVAQGKSIGSLVTSLNRLGILTRYGRPWTRQQILKILRSSIYAGRAYRGKRERRNGRLVSKGGTGKGILTPVEPMVTEETFQRVQRQLDKNRISSPRNTRQTYLLQHLLACRECSKTFIARSRVNRFGEPLKRPLRYYGCQGMKKSPGAYACRRPAELNADKLEELVWNKVAEAFAEPQSLLDILKTRTAAIAEKTRTLKKELEAASEQLKNKNLELQQVLSWARQNLLSPDGLKPQLAQVREQKQHWETEIDSLMIRLSSLKPGKCNLEEARQLCLSIRERMANTTQEQKKELLQLLVERIWVDGGNNLQIDVVIPKPETHPAVDNCETAHSLKGEGVEDY